MRNSTFKIMLNYSKTLVRQFLKRFLHPSTHPLHTASFFNFLFFLFQNLSKKSQKLPNNSPKTAPKKSQNSQNMADAKRTPSYSSDLVTVGPENVNFGQIASSNIFSNIITTQQRAVNIIPISVGPRINKGVLLAFAQNILWLWRFPLGCVANQYFTSLELGLKPVLFYSYTLKIQKFICNFRFLILITSSNSKGKLQPHCSSHPWKSQALDPVTASLILRLKNWLKRTWWGTYRLSSCVCITDCCIFRPAFGCCALQTLVEIVIFNVFAAKNLKKARNLQQILAKDSFFFNLHQNAGRLLKMTILTSVWSAQHPNAGRNLQHFHLL